MRRLAYQWRYGYRFHDALRAEFWWRVEHLPLSYEGQVVAPLARRGYRRRKAAERRAVARLCAANAPDSTGKAEE